MKTIYPLNPSAEYQLYKTEIDAAIAGVLSKGTYILGDEVKNFEEEFASFTGSRYAIGVASGTDALYLALKAINIGAGDEVITVSNTAVATAMAILQADATPVFVDIDEANFTINPELIENAIGPKTKAIVAVHLFGNAADISALTKIADKYNIKFIEDCAQSFGTYYDHKHVGTFGACGSFSFYPTKNLGAIGDGGMVITDDEATYLKLKGLRQYGWEKRYISESFGWNSRLDEIQAAILRIKLRHFKSTLKMRIAIAEKYINGVKNQDIILPVSNINAIHSYHLFVIKSLKRDKLKSYLSENNIETLIHYPVPIHQQPAFARMSSQPVLKYTELVSDQILSLPIYAGLDDANIDYIVDKLNNFR